jgi:hypothetical protein
MSNPSFTMNSDALIVIINALLWAAHDTRLPQEERFAYKDLADKLAPIVVPLELKETNETSDDNICADSTSNAVGENGDTATPDNDNDNNAG